MKAEKGLKKSFIEILAEIKIYAFGRGLNWDLNFQSQLCSNKLTEKKRTQERRRKNSIRFVTYSRTHLGRLTNYQQDSIPRSIPHYCRPPASVLHASSCNLTLNPAWLNSLAAVFGCYSGNSVCYNSDLLRNYHMLVWLAMMSQTRDVGKKNLC